MTIGLIPISTYHATVAKLRGSEGMVNEIMRHSYAQCPQCRHGYLAWNGVFDYEAQRFYCSASCARGAGCSCKRPVSNYQPDTRSPYVVPDEMRAQVDEVRAAVRERAAAIARGEIDNGLCGARRSDGKPCRIKRPCWYH